MPVAVSYPGVYIQEVPNGVRTITSVSTSIAAFIDFFKEGPMDKAVQIFGMGDFNRIYGGLDKRSPASYAIMQFFLNGGTEAYVVRVTKKDTVGSELKTANIIIQNVIGTAANILEIEAANPGIWGNNLRVDIDHNTSNPTKYFNLYVTRYNGTSGTAQAIASETFLGLSVVPKTSKYVETVVNDSSKLIRVEHVAAKTSTPDTTTLPAATGTLGGDISTLNTAAFNNLRGKKFNIQIGSGTVQTVTIGTWTAGAVTNLTQLRPYIEQAIRTIDSTSPVFAGARVEVVEGKYLRILSGRRSNTYAPAELVVISKSGADTTAETLKLSGAGLLLGNNVQEYQLGATTSVSAMITGVTGGDGTEPTPAEIIGSQATEPHTGMYALDYVDLFNIMCVPRTAELVDADMVTAVDNLLKYCSDKRAFMIIDIPSSINEVQKMKDWLDAKSSFRHNNAAVYFPQPLISDPLDEYRLKSVGASGAMAGLYARTDSSRGVWKAPAGIEATLSGVPKLNAKLTDAQNGTLNPLGINCLRTFPIYGNIAWGGRTTQGADAIGSEWKYIPVRRLALNLEESLFRGTKWVVFEPNDEPTWANIRMNLNAYMMSLFRQGAFQGTDPKAAFYVKCDKETTTQDDINKGIVNIEVGFAPLKPAEFVVIKIQQIAGEL